MEEKIKTYIEQFKKATQHLDHSDGNLKKQDIKFVISISHIIEIHPGIKSGESKFIAEKSLLIAEAFDLPPEEKENILYAGLLIQIGKILLPDNLLKKPFYSLSIVDKYRYLGHAVDGSDLLNGLVQFKVASTLIRHQNERYNGQGFPDGLAKHNIPLGSRILAVVSDYIAFIDGSMTGKIMFSDDALSQLMIRKESNYDPDIVDVFSNVIKGASVEELKEAIVKAKLLAVATERWRKGLVIKERNSKILRASIVEISLQQLKLGMKVDSIYFGSELYIRNCMVDQSIIDNVLILKQSKKINPIIKIVLDLTSSPT